jgi:hypothetical protein
MKADLPAAAGPVRLTFAARPAAGLAMDGFRLPPEDVIDRPGAPGRSRPMRTEFAYRDAGGVGRRGLPPYEDAPCGPVCAYPDAESCCTFAAGTCQAGGVGALLIRQAVDAIVKLRHIPCRDRTPEELLAHFIDWTSRGNRELRDALRGLLADYLG